MAAKNAKKTTKTAATPLERQARMDLKALLKKETGPAQDIAKEVEKPVQEHVEAAVDQLQVTELVKLAQDQGMSVSETSGFYKVEGTKKGLRMYVAKKGNRLTDGQIEDVLGLVGFHQQLVAIRRAHAAARTILERMEARNDD